MRLALFGVEAYPVKSGSVLLGQADCSLTKVVPCSGRLLRVETCFPKKILVPEKQAAVSASRDPVGLLVQTHRLFNGGRNELLHVELVAFDEVIKRRESLPVRVRRNLETVKVKTVRRGARSDCGNKFSEGFDTLSGCCICTVLDLQVGVLVVPSLDLVHSLVRASRWRCIPPPFQRNGLSILQRSCCRTAATRVTTGAARRCHDRS